jgi:5-methylcytosine-specific restriction endonuclease McrA
MAFDREKKHKQVKRISERDGMRCTYCGCKLHHRAFNPNADWTVPGYAQIEHVVPRSQGGSSSLENLVLSCRSCNSRKGTKTPSDYAQYIADNRKVSAILRDIDFVQAMYADDQIVLALLSYIQRYRPSFEEAA